jgi:hypothetical protein
MAVLLGMGIGFFPVHEAEKRPDLIEVSALRLAYVRFSFVNLPCLVLASVRRARPASVRGPVDAPPCKWHLPLRFYAGRCHFELERVLAP